MNDIQNRSDIIKMVDTFYEKVRSDVVLGPVFMARIPGDWGPHLDTLYRFWDSAIFGANEYVGNPILKHTSMSLRGEHFERWLDMFCSNLDEHFKGPVTEETKFKAIKMADGIYRRVKDQMRDLKPFPEIKKSK